jgi:ribosomal protein S18 acetylase RimI-like enzyme
MSSCPLRELREDDADAVAALFVDTFGAARKLDGEEIRSWVRNTELRPEWLRVLEEDGRVVGYGDIWPQDDVLDLDVAAPGRWDVFFDWAETEARRRGIPHVRIQVPHGHELGGLVAARGYEPWRFSYTMEIDLDERPSARMPVGIELRGYGDDDGAAVRALINEAFAADPFWHEVDEANFREFYLGGRGFEPALWLLACDGDEVAGCALNFPVHGSDESLGWVATLGVRPAWRRRGLGEALLLSSFAALHDRGLRRVGLGVDSQNATGALRLYERVGMRKVRQSDNWRREL